MKKQIGALLLAVILVLTMTTGAFAAPAGTELTLAADYKADVTVVSLSMKGAEGVTNGQVSISYDPKLVTLTANEVAVSCGSASVNRETAGTASLAWVGSQLTEEETLVWKLTFQAVEGATQNVTYRAAAAELYVGETKLEAAPAAVTVTVNPFTDIDGHWAEDDILKAYHAGLFKGMTSTTFGPEGKLNRAMFVTVLYRMAGSPAVENAKTNFTDLREGAYYQDAVAWAVKTGVTKGVSATAFAPGKQIDRQETATMLYRYAQLMGQDTTKRAELSDFRDDAQVSGWAEEAVAWAVAEGILKGYPGELLLPNGDTTRAQAAVILSRYLGL